MGFFYCCQLCFSWVGCLWVLGVRGAWLQARWEAETGHFWCKIWVSAPELMCQGDHPTAWPPVVSLEATAYPSVLLLSQCLSSYIRLNWASED